MLGRASLGGGILLKRGRIGSGEEINIWKQRWLPRKHPPRQPICSLESFENCTMDLIIDPNTRTWNEGLIDGLFVEEDAKLINKIPLSQAANDDSLYWPYSTSGHYTCKSGYMFLKQVLEMKVSQQALPIHDKQLWKKIWPLQVPPKIKNFLWRACRNVFPTKQALLKRKVTADPICERCRSAVEEFMHAVWSCLKLGEVWGVGEEWCFTVSGLSWSLQM